jgi:hypothetical protein
MSRSVNVYIAGNIVYVSGTVNGKAYTWTLTADHTWSAEVDRDANDVYDIHIEATNSAGTVGKISTTIYYGLHLITNRRGGFYNASDLNRVGAAVEFINERLTECGFNISVAVRTDWTSENVPVLSDMNAYLLDVASIRAALAVLPSTPTLPDDMHRLTAEKANDIEKILKDVDWLISNMIAAYHYSGELYSGEV